MRPLGAIVLGSYVDRIGRRQGLIVTLGIMACGTVLIAFVPDYSQIGLAAPLLVLLGRLLQGFSAGVELGGVSVYLAEIATPGHKGFYTSWQSASQQVAIVVAAAIGYGIQLWLSPEQIAAWGWRVPFFIGCLIIPLIFLLRGSLQETDAFLARKHRPSLREIFGTIGLHWRTIVAGMFLVSLTTTLFYFITVYTPTFGKSVLHLSAQDSLIVTLCVGLSNFAGCPSAGPVRPHRPQTAAAGHFAAGLADRLPGHGLAGSCQLYPAADGVAVVLFLLWHVQRCHGGRADRGDAGVCAHRGLFAGLQPGHCHLRRADPAVSTALVEMTHSKSSPAYWLLFALSACLATLVLFAPRRQHQHQHQHQH
jgi:MHS family citrate/tricarballylate:H+ symporter-like MFS transporter